MKRFSLLTGVLVSAAGLAAAQDAAKTPEAPKTSDLFKQLDKNSDGKVEKEEVNEEQRRYFERLLRIGDENQDGVLTAAEFEKGSRDEPTRPAAEPGGRGPQGPGPGEFFQQLDRNGDGKITREELPEPLRERLGRMMEEMGKDSLTREDLERMRGRMTGGFGAPPEEMIKRMDRNGDGKLQKDELGELPEQMRNGLLRYMEGRGVETLTAEDIARMRGQEMFRQLDRNGDGKLTKDEIPEPMRERVAGYLEENKKEGLTQEDFNRLRERAGAEPGRPGERRPEGDRPRPDGSPARGEGDRPRTEGDRPRTEGDRPRPDGDRPRPDGERGPMPEGGRGRMEMERRPGPDGQPRLPRFMEVLDKDRDGRLSRAELEQAAKLMGELDTNENGTLEPFELFGPPPGAGRDGMPPRRDGDDFRRPEGGDRPRPEGDGPRPDGERRPEGARPGQDGPRRPEGGFAPNPEEMLKRLDQNGDGIISREEAPERLRENFDRIDTNGDGKLTPDELRQLGERFRNAQPGRGEPGRDAGRDRRPQSEDSKPADRERDRDT